MTDEQADDDLVSLNVADALEIYAAIFKLTVDQAADHLRSEGGARWSPRAVGKLRAL